MYPLFAVLLLGHHWGALAALLTIGALGMTYTVLSPIQLKLDNYAVVAGDLAITFTAMDASNGNSFAATGEEILIFNNTDSAAHTITINSVADSLGRSDVSLTSYSIPATSFAAIQMKFLPGWVSDGVISMTTTSALVKVAVLRWQ